MILIIFLQVKSWFKQWPDLIVRLDIWHFMRRFASACSTEAHLLYAIFLRSLSHCLFEWDAADVAALMEAKRSELEQQGVPLISEDVIRRALTRAELARHCRRRTRGVAETTTRLDALVETFESKQGNDVHGVPLFPKGSLRQVWHKQRRHVECIQDPNVNLYFREPRTVSKGGMPLPVYKCARGSTSLEGFHCHVARFIPGKNNRFNKSSVYKYQSVFQEPLPITPIFMPSISRALPDGIWIGPRLGQRQTQICVAIPRN